MRLWPQPFLNSEVKDEETQVENVKFGVQVNPNYHDKIKVAVIASNFAKDITFDEKQKFFNTVEDPDDSYEERESTLPNYLSDFLAEEDSKKQTPSTIADLQIQHEKEEKQQQMLEEERELEQRKMENPLYDFFADEEKEDKPIEESVSSSQEDEENISTIIVDDYEGDEDSVVIDSSLDTSEYNLETDDDDENFGNDIVDDEDDDDSVVIDRPM